jgi:hypothetical protein
LWLPAFATAIFLGTGLESRAHAGPLVANGGFEQTSLASPGGYLCNDNGAGGCASNVTSWTSTCTSAGPCGGHGTPSSLLFANTNGIAWNGGIGLAGTIANSPDGGNFVALDGSATYRSAIMQTIGNLTVGDTYYVTFFQAGAQQNGSTGPTTEQFAVSLGSSTAYSTLMNDVQGGFVPWEKQTLAFVATSTSEVLSFLALGTPNGEPPVVLLDDVSMSVPEPGTVAMLAAGVLGLMVARRRMRAST